MNDGNLRSLDFGKLPLELSAEAWGFAGASLMLAPAHAFLGTPATSATIRETTTRHLLRTANLLSEIRLSCHAYSVSNAPAE